MTFVFDLIMLVYAYMVIFEIYLLKAANPVFKRCVLLSPGVWRSNNKDPIGCQHFLQIV